MALSDDLNKDITEIFTETFEVSSGWSIPTTADVTFDNQGKKIRLVSLFVDIRKSTTLVSAMGLESAARMYKAYIRGITKIVRARGGEILSFNGDGVVAGFVGVSASNAAVLSALNLCCFLFHQLKPWVDQVLIWTSSPELRFDFGIGIDAGDVLVVKAGMKGEDNHDLVWAGNPVNYSVKVSSLASDPYRLYVSDLVFDRIHHSLKESKEGNFIWDAWWWTEKSKLLWRTEWWFGPEYITSVPPAPAIGIIAKALAAIPPKPAPVPGILDFYRPPRFQPPSLADLMNPKAQPSKTIADILYELSKKK
jgi:uridylate cyclase